MYSGEMTTLAAQALKDAEIVAWNTGNSYTEHGQRISAMKLKDGRVYFMDVDRSIDGVTMMPITGQYMHIKEFVTHAYDYLHYNGGYYELREIYPHIGWEGAAAIRKYMEDAALGVGGSANKPQPWMAKPYIFSGAGIGR
jgi:hypothetical protein